MFKTVNFNIFEENLQDIVYGKKSVPHEKDAERAGAKGCGRTLVARIHLFEAGARRADRPPLTRRQ